MQAKKAAPVKRPTTTKKPNGRPQAKIDIAEVEEMAAHGLSFKEISICLGITERTLQRRKKLQKDLEEAIERGRTKGIQAVANKLFEQCMGGNSKAMVFYLQARGGWTTKQEVKADVTSTVKTEIQPPEGLEEIYLRFKGNDKDGAAGS